MEITRTTPVKLDVFAERREDLDQTIDQFNHACNYTVQKGRNDDSYLILKKSKIHDHVYHDLRDESEVLNGAGKPFGNSAHVTVPKRWRGADVKVIRTSESTEQDEE